MEIAYDINHALKRKIREGMWDAGQTVCIDTPRLLELRDAKHELIPPSKFPDSLQPDKCKGGTCDAKAWKAAVLAECGIHSGCNASTPHDLRSYTVVKENRVNFEKNSGHKPPDK
jgi:hypothetical protein